MSRRRQQRFSRAKSFASMPRYEKAVEALGTAYANGVLDDTDLTPEGLQRLRDTALAWPEGTRVEHNSFEIHQMLNEHPQRHWLIQREWTEERLRAYLDAETQAYARAASEPLIDPRVPDGDRRVRGIQP